MNAAFSELLIGDYPLAWQSAGFTVENDTVRIGGVTLRLVGESDGRGVLSWGFDTGFPTSVKSVEGLSTHVSTPTTESRTNPAEHPNGAQHVDHLVVMTPDLGRSISAFEDFGLELRRIRDTGTKEQPTQQAFFWIGDTILELVGPKEPRGNGPAAFFGIAVVAEDLVETVRFLGEHCGAIKDAVQPGRQVATLRHQAFGMSVPLIFMSPHQNPTDLDA